MTNVRFLKFCVTDGTVKAKVHYSLDNRHDRRKCVTIYARDYGGELGAILGDAYENKTDTQTDYFDKGNATLFEDHPLYAAARSRAESVLAEYAAKAEARHAARTR